VRPLSNNSAFSVLTRVVSAALVAAKEVLALVPCFAGFRPLDEWVALLLAEGLVVTVRRNGEFMEGRPWLLLLLGRD